MLSHQPGLLRRLFSYAVVAGGAVAGAAFFTNDIVPANDNGGAVRVTPVVTVVSPPPVADNDWPGSLERRTTETALKLDGEDVATAKLSARDALAWAADETAVPDNLSVEQTRLLSLIREAQAIPLGRELTKMAADRDIWYVIDNNIRGGGYYNDELRLVALEGSDTGAEGVAGREAYDHSSDEEFARFRHWYREALYHELVHVCQGQVWKNLAPPAGMRSFDKKLWNLSVESQADLIAGEAMRQHAYAEAGLPIGSAPAAELCAAFTGDIVGGSDFHRVYYNFKAGELYDGAAVDPAAYAAAFGCFPGREDNFLSGSMVTVEAIYNALVMSDAHLKECYEAAEKRRQEILNPSPVPPPPPGPSV